MAPFIKVNVINKVKGQFGQQINKTDLTNWSTKQSEPCNNRQVSKLFFTVAQLKGQSVKVQVILGHILSLSST